MTARKLGTMTVDDDVFEIRRLWLGEGIFHVEARADLRYFRGGRRNVTICGPDGYLIGTVEGVHFSGKRAKADAYVVIDLPIEMVEMTATVNRRTPRKCS